MKIAVIGAGAIGGLVAGYLKLQNEEVFLVGRSDTVEAVRQRGLEISGIRGNFNIPISIAQKLDSPADLAILATKTQDIGSALADNLKFLQYATVLTTQNGLRADEIVTRYIPAANIVSSIVMFGATYLEPAKIVHNFEGKWIIGSMFAKDEGKLMGINRLLNKIFPSVVTDELKGMKYLKIFFEANNCLPALLGVSVQEAFSDLEVSKIAIAIWKEGLSLATKLGINLISLPDFPLERLTKTVALRIEETAHMFSGIMTTLSKEPLYGSILQSIKRGRPSEIDYINGEFIRMAKELEMLAPLNATLLDMVHRVEKTNKFFSKQELLEKTKELVKEVIF
jgi:2-dehydropantoate 2-reductase